MTRSLPDEYYPPVSPVSSNMLPDSIPKVEESQYEDGLRLYQDDPLANQNGGGVDYKTVSWWQCGFLMIAETISLGILSLPQVVAHVGFVPGVLLIAGLGLLATYTGYIIFQLKMAYPQIHNFADAVELMLGRVGKEVAGFAQTMIFLFLMAAHVLTFSIMMNVLTDHGACNMIFGAVGTILSIFLSLPRTLKNMSYLSIFSAASIVIAVVITMVGVGVEKPGLGDTFAIVPAQLTSVQKGSMGAANIVIAYTGHIAYFGFVSELKQPRDFPKSLALLQTIAITLYVVVAVVIYYFAGTLVKSPALGSASHIVEKVAYGIAIPTILIAGVIYAHMCAKNIYIRLLRKRNPALITARGIKAYLPWIAIISILWTIAFIIASAIPVFEHLLGLVGALFCSWFSLGLPSIFWLWMRWGSWNKGWKNKSLVLVNFGILAVCIGVCGMGTWASVTAIAASADRAKPFSCGQKVVR